MSSQINSSKCDKKIWSEMYTYMSKLVKNMTTVFRKCNIEKIMWVLGKLKKLLYYRHSKCLVESFLVWQEPSACVKNLFLVTFFVCESMKIDECVSKPCSFWFVNIRIFIKFIGQLWRYLNKEPEWVTFHSSTCTVHLTFSPLPTRSFLFVL